MYSIINCLVIVGARAPVLPAALYGTRQPGQGSSTQYCLLAFLWEEPLKLAKGERSSNWRLWTTVGCHAQEQEACLCTRCQL